MLRLYPEAAYRAAPDPGNLWQTTLPTPSVPPLDGDAEAEVIGAGFTGLHAALRLAATPGWQGLACPSLAA